MPFTVLSVQSGLADTKIEKLTNATAAGHPQKIVTVAFKVFRQTFPIKCQTCANTKNDVSHSVNDDPNDKVQTEPSAVAAGSFAKALSTERRPAWQTRIAQIG